MKKMILFATILALFVFTWFFVIFWKNSTKLGDVAVDTKFEKVERLFDVCNKKQAVINTPMAPDCCMKALKDNGFSTTEASDFLMKKGIDIDNNELSEFWKEAWDRYYKAK